MDVLYNKSSSQFHAIFNSAHFIGRKICIRIHIHTTAILSGIPLASYLLQQYYTELSRVCLPTRDREGKVEIINYMKRLWNFKYNQLKVS